MLFYGADSYITKSGTLKRFPPDTRKFFQKWNGLAEKLKDICVQRLNGCHIINAPENLVVDIIHHFVLHPKHFMRFGDSVKRIHAYLFSGAIADPDLYGAKITNGPLVVILRVLETLLLVGVVDCQE